MLDLLCLFVLSWIIKNYFSILVSVLHAHIEAKVIDIKKSFFDQIFFSSRKKFSCHFSI